MTDSNTLIHARQNQLKSVGPSEESWAVETKGIGLAGLIGKMISEREKPQHFIGSNIEKKNMSCRLAS